MRSCLIFHVTVLLIKQVNIKHYLLWKKHMETLNKYFLFEIRELLDSHIIPNELNRPNTKLENRNSSVNTSTRSEETLIARQKMADNSFTRDKIQIEITMPRY